METQQHNSTDAIKDILVEEKVLLLLQGFISILFVGTLEYITTFCLSENHELYPFINGIKIISPFIAAFVMLLLISFFRNKLIFKRKIWKINNIYKEQIKSIEKQEKNYNKELKMCYDTKVRTQLEASLNELHRKKMDILQEKITQIAALKTEFLARYN